MIPEPVTDPAGLAALFERDRETHIYGLADLEEPYWTSSSWYLVHEAAVGAVSVGGDWVAAYAMSRNAPQATIDLLIDVLPTLPPGTLVVGPETLTQQITDVRRVTPLGAHLRMMLRDPASLARSDACTALGPTDLPALEALHAADPGAAFFLPEMLSTGHFVGIWEGGDLIASAGTHVVSDRYGVAAIGAVITHPAHRGRGLGRAVTSDLGHQLAARYPTVGLNASAHNRDALRLYEQLGFVSLFTYEEAVLE